MDQIVRGKSMSVYSDKPKFYSSSIVGGILPIALGTAMSIKMKGEHNKVWCFVGDMTFESGLFYETYKYSRNFGLPLEFVVEDNGYAEATSSDYSVGGNIVDRGKAYGLHAEKVDGTDFFAVHQAAKEAVERAKNN